MGIFWCTHTARILHVILSSWTFEEGENQGQSKRKKLNRKIRHNCESANDLNGWLEFARLLKLAAMLRRKKEWLGGTTMKRMANRLRFKLSFIPHLCWASLSGCGRKCLIKESYSNVRNIVRADTTELYPNVMHWISIIPIIKAILIRNPICVLLSLFNMLCLENSFLVLFIYLFLI